jgi:DNA-binding GntR family transcriptional regulator
MLTLKQHAYKIIREKLLTGVAKPGSRLSDDVLAREMGISRSPVREAISQLASEGLVEHRPRSGAYVKQPDPPELQDLFEIRESLERYAARKAAQNMSPDGVARLLELCDEMRTFVQECRAAPTKTATPDLVRRFLHNDLAFHTIILDASGNSRLTKLVTDFKLLTQIFTFTRAVEHNVQIMINTYRYHRRIAQAFQAREAKAAASWMARHIRNAKDMVLAGYEKGAVVDPTRKATGE